jgi:DNA processing protein
MANAAISQEEQLNWLALHVVPGLGTLRALRLVERWKSPEAIFRATASELEASGVSAAIARTISSGCSFEDAVDQHQKLKEADCELITLHDPRYPTQLRDIYDPPLVLYARGRLELLETYSVAIVGTRRPTPYGLAAAERFGADLAHAGLTIVSGMARGIDTAAHKAALSVDGNTISVFGCGIDVLYPADNRRLYEQIARCGLMLSEFPMSTPAYPQNFPIRNRIVSGLTLGVVVIEGAQYSGSAITARLAVEQGREVFAVPGNVTSKMSWGTNLLIKQGTAKLIQEWSDVVGELPAHVRRHLVNRRQKELAGGVLCTDPGCEDTTKVAPLHQLSQRILNQLQVDVSKQFDDLVESFQGVSSSEIIAALFDLEINGLVRQLPGRNFVKVW